MPVNNEIKMRSVVYVIIEDRESKEIFSCSALLFNVNKSSTESLLYVVELLEKIAMHQAGQHVTVDESNIFRTYDECKAVSNDRGRRLYLQNEDYNASVRYGGSNFFEQLKELKK